MKKKDNKLSVMTRPLFVFRQQRPSGNFSSTDPTTTLVTLTTSAPTGLEVGGKWDWN